MEVSATKPARSPDEPRISFRTWCWVIAVPIAINAMYVASWPLVMGSVPCAVSVVGEIDQRTGAVVQRMVTDPSPPPAVVTFYWPVLYTAYAAHIPFLSGGLCRYEESVLDAFGMLGPPVVLPGVVAPTGLPTPGQP